MQSRIFAFEQPNSLDESDRKPMEIINNLTGHTTELAQLDKLYSRSLEFGRRLPSLLCLIAPWAKISCLSSYLSDFLLDIHEEKSILQNPLAQSGSLLPLFLTLIHVGSSRDFV